MRYLCILTMDTMVTQSVQKKTGLKVGEKYEVDYISMGQSYTSIYLKGVEGCFNSVQFEFQEANGAPVNIYRDSRYNPYLNF